MSYELRFGDLIVHALVDDESLEVAAGPIDKPNVVIEAQRRRSARSSTARSTAKRP